MFIVIQPKPWDDMRQSITWGNGYISYLSLLKTGA